MHSQFESIRQEFQRRLYSYAYYSLRVAEDAEDIVQEAFVKLWENLYQVDSSQAGAWLMRVTQNLIVDHLRRKRSRPGDEVDAGESSHEQLPAPGGEPHRQEAAGMKRIVEESIAGLGDPYRTILILREIQGLSYQEIARFLDISVDHVKTDLFRGKRKLRGIVRRHPLYHPELLTQSATD